MQGAAPTRDEVVRRTNICWDWLSIMRGDMGYSLVRCLDLLPGALRAALDGDKVTLEASTRSWSPSKEEKML